MALMTINIFLPIRKAQRYSLYISQLGFQLQIILMRTMSSGSNVRRYVATYDCKHILSFIMRLE